jgi:hypothetical protein
MTKLLLRITLLAAALYGLLCLADLLSVADTF